MHKDLSQFNEEIHSYIISELFLKTLERDRQYLPQLKMHTALDKWYEMKINEVFNELKSNRNFLYKKGCKIEKLRKDDFATEYQVLFRGKSETRRYVNIALRNWVQEEMKRVLGMEFRTPADRV